MMNTALKIGFCGAHRVGKTTLAEQFADAAGLPFARTSASAVFAERGLKPDQKLSMEQRLGVQEDILDSFTHQWAEQRTGFVSDRTPIDMAAYTLGDVTGSVMLDGERVQQYLAHCREATNTYFDVLVVVQPGIRLVHEPGKAALNPAYIEHLNAIVMGLVADPALDAEKMVMERDCVEMSDRMDALAAFLDSVEAA